MRCASLCLLVAALAAADPPPQGMDVVEAARAAGRAVGLPAPPEDKPWANEVAALTDPDPGTHGPAIRALGRRGAAVLPDLEVLAGDEDYRIRMRLLQVLQMIGGAQAAPLSLRLSEDRDPRVRELAFFALGSCVGEGVLPRLERGLEEPFSLGRQAAARALASLADPRAIPALARLGRERDDLVRRDMASALAGLVATPEGVPVAAEWLARGDDAQREALLEALPASADPRLCPPLVEVVTGASGPRSDWLRYLAVRGLAWCGDLRACEALVPLAEQAAREDLRLAAAETLTILTGWRAAPGRAWTVWWNDRRAAVTRLARRDALLAALHDPRAPIDPTALAEWSVADLTSLVDACLGRPEDRIPAWWPERAWRILAADDPQRWIPALADRAIALPLTASLERLALAAMVEQLGGPTALHHLRRQAADLETRSKEDAQRAKELNLQALDAGPERTVLRLAIERLGRRP